MRLVRFSGAEPFALSIFSSNLSQVASFTRKFTSFVLHLSDWHRDTQAFTSLPTPSHSLSHMQTRLTLKSDIFIFSSVDVILSPPLPHPSALACIFPQNPQASPLSQAPVLGPLFREGLLVRKSAKVAGGIIGARVGVQTHGCWAWGDQVASQGFPGPRGSRGWAWTKGWGRRNRGQRPSPAARQPERTHFRHPETLCGLDGVWELPVGHPDLDNQLRHVQGLLNRTIF